MAECSEHQPFVLRFCMPESLLSRVGSEAAAYRVLSDRLFAELRGRGHSVYRLGRTGLPHHVVPAVERFVREVAAHLPALERHVPDSRDHCAGSPPGSRVNDVGCLVGAEEEHGAAQSCSDSDLDGVCDGEDECPGTTLGTRVDKHGCPANSEAQTAPDEPDTSSPPPAP